MGSQRSCRCWTRQRRGRGMLPERCSSPSPPSARTKKVPKPIMLAPATDKHPAQTQLITVDEYVGDWELVKHSGAVPADDRRSLVRNIEKLQRAVKYAREQANMTDAPPVEAGETILGWLLS